MLLSFMSYYTQPGIQGQLWSETVRTGEQFDSMVFPRLLAVAQRAWHKDSWEYLMSDEVERKKQRDAAWGLFANTLGYKELRRLDDLGVSYNVPAPGAKYVNSLYSTISQLDSHNVRNGSGERKLFSQSENPKTR